MCCMETLACNTYYSVSLYLSVLFFYITVALDVTHSQKKLLFDTVLNVRLSQLKQ